MPHRKLVLIVDDVPTNLAVATGALKELFRTKVATNGAKALKIASGAEKPDLVLLDVMMPDMDGYEVCRRLKANPDTAGIPIVFITAKTSEDDRAKGIEAGAIDYIHKPFEAPVLIERVQAHLARQDRD
jgi:CheY-like chemotaxis protein